MSKANKKGSKKTKKDEPNLELMNQVEEFQEKLNQTIGLLKIRGESLKIRESKIVDQIKYLLSMISKAKTLNPDDADKLLDNYSELLSRSQDIHNRINQNNSLTPEEQGYNNQINELILNTSVLSKRADKLFEEPELKINPDGTVAFPKI